MAKFIIISKSFALDILVTGIGHMVDPKWHPQVRYRTHLCVCHANL